MARIVLTCWGSLGDLFPYLAIARRLHSMGHDVLLAAPGYYRARVEQEGVRFLPMRPDVDPSDGDLIRRIMDGARGTEVILRELVVPHTAGALQDVRSAIGGADLVVTHPMTFGARLAAEVQGVRWISTVLAPTSFFSLHDFPVLPPAPAVVRVIRRSPWLAALFMRVARRVTAPWVAPVHRLRTELGLPPAGDPLYEGQFSPHGTLALFSPLFGRPQRDWPLATTITGFVPYRSDAETMPADVAKFLDDGPPPVVFTLGSSAVGAAGRFYEESVAVAESLRCRAVLLVGLDPRNRSPRPLPPQIMASAYVPHGLLFPRAAAVVHHGGIGTMAEALAAGRPMLVVPHAHDQPDNAFRAERLGVARAIDAHRFSKRRVVPLLSDLLSHERYASRARAVGQQLASEDGLTAASRAIELAARGSRP